MEGTRRYHKAGKQIRKTATRGSRNDEGLERSEKATSEQVPKGKKEKRKVFCVSFCTDSVSFVVVTLRALKGGRVLKLFQALVLRVNSFMQ